PAKGFSLSFQLSTRGYLSIWPASGQLILMNHTPCCTPEDRQLSNTQAPLTIPKPLYLEQLESYLKKELQTLDLTEKSSQELKLQPYREIFEFFINDFKTYKPLLLAVKNEYEATLAHQTKTIRALEPLKTMVTTVSEAYTQQIVALQEKEKDEINMLKQEKQHLLKCLDNMKEENAFLRTQVEHLKASLAKEYTHNLKESKARKRLLAKLNDAYGEQLDATRHQVQDIKGEDKVEFTLALKVAQRDLTNAQMKLNAMIADYRDVVPRSDFESLEQKYSDLLQEMNTLQKDFDQLHKEQEALLETHRETTEERDMLSTELQRARHNCTPRPDWAKCSEVIHGGAAQWDHLAKGKTSNQLVDVLLEEIATAELRERDVFPGQGTDEQVPVYLRHKGDVKNKHLTKKDVVTLLKDVWNEKIALDEQTGKQSHLPEFFLSYLQKKYGETDAIEWSYNLYENMRFCRSNHILSLFYDVLTGKVGEEEYHSQNQLLSNLQKQLIACDSSDSRVLTQEQFRQEATTLRETFPLKRRQSIQELLDASSYQLDSTGDLVDYISLFEEDDEGNTEPFVVRLRSQYIREKQEYLQQLKNELGDVAEVKADDLKIAFCAINPDVDGQTLDTYIGLAYQLLRQQPEQELVPMETVLEKLLTGDIRQAG
ncbi:TXIP1 protein, partial [Rhinopomastus cyanomelas]|nr:TXIP1 protein [Rhinopomastus cyanomelas]